VDLDGIKGSQSFKNYLIEKSFKNEKSVGKGASLEQGIGDGEEDPQIPWRKSKEG